MSEEEIVILNPIGITCNQADPKVTAFQFVGQDKNGTKYMMTFASKSFYQPTIVKYLSRLIPVNVNYSEENEDDGRT